jgi:serine/threonine protein phosphatase 1
MMARTIAIGDIHGCSAALAALLNCIQPGPTDTIIALGDYIDRGPDSRGVLDQLIDLAGHCRLVPLLGNHEEMLLAAVRDRGALRRWLECGVVETLRSYEWSPGGSKRSLADVIPASHRAFLSACQSHHETANHIFAHAGYVPDLPMDQQPGMALRWRVTSRDTAKRHYSGKRIIVGHTPQTSGEILDLGFLVCIDTGCCRGGWLTALDVEAGGVWQANQWGDLRRHSG